MRVPSVVLVERDIDQRRRGKGFESLFFFAFDDRSVGRFKARRESPILEVGFHDVGALFHCDVYSF